MDKFVAVTLPGKETTRKGIRAARFHGITATAKALGVSRQHLFEVFKGRRKGSQDLLARYHTLKSENTLPMKQPSLSALARLQRSNVALLKRSQKRLVKLTAQVERIKQQINCATPGYPGVEKLVKSLRWRERVIVMETELIAEISKDISEVSKDSALNLDPQNSP